MPSMQAYLTRNTAGKKVALDKTPDEARNHGDVVRFVADVQPETVGAGDKNTNDQGYARKKGAKAVLAPGIAAVVV